MSEEKKSIGRLQKENEALMLLADLYLKRNKTAEEKIALREGVVTLLLPTLLSEESITEIADWFKGIVRRARRRVLQEDGKTDGETDAKETTP